jgi:phosphate:Na+ symporter
MIFDIIGSTVFGALIIVFPGILRWFQETWAEGARQVAMFHTLYNVSTMVLLLPLIKQVALLMEKIIPVKSDGKEALYEKKLNYLDERIMKTPSIAVLNAHLEINRMAKIANDNLVLSMEAFLEMDLEKAKKVLEIEETVNYLNHNIASKLVLINNMSLSSGEAERTGKMFRILTDIERIADHAENIAEYTIAVESNGLKFSDSAITEIKTLSSITIELISKAISTFEHMDESQLPIIKDLEEQVDRLSIEFTENHIKRLKAEDCEPESGVIFTDMIIDLERSGDHANNIAFSVLPESKWKKD